MRPNVEFQVDLSKTNPSLAKSHLQRYMGTRKKQAHNTVPTFIFAMKQYLHLHLLWNRTIICTEAMPTFIFTMKPWQHCTLALALALKLHQYLYWSRDNIHLCHEAKLILHLRRSRANVHLCHEAMTTLHISINFQRQHSSDFKGA